MCFCSLRAKNLLRSLAWDESRSCFVVPPKFGAHAPSFLAEVENPCDFGPEGLIRRLGRCPSRCAASEAFSLWPPSLPAKRAGTASASKPVNLLSGKREAAVSGAGNALFRENEALRGKKDHLRSVRLGLIISRQSRSPRWRPMTSISAVARFVAIGTLCISQRWIVCMSC